MRITCAALGVSPAPHALVQQLCELHDLLLRALQQLPQARIVQQRLRSRARAPVRPGNPQLLAATRTALRVPGGSAAAGDGGTKMGRGRGRSYLGDAEGVHISRGQHALAQGLELRHEVCPLGWGIRVSNARPAFSKRTLIRDTRKCFAFEGGAAF